MNQQNQNQDEQVYHQTQQQNNPQDIQISENGNQNTQNNQSQSSMFFWRDIPYSSQQVQQRKQLENLIQHVENTANDKFIYQSFLEKICNKFQYQSLKVFDDVSNIEQLRQIIDQQYYSRRMEQQSKLFETLNIINDLNDKINMSEFYQIMKILKSPNRIMNITKDLTKEEYFYKIKEDLDPEEKELQNKQKAQGIFDNYKISPIQVFKRQMNQIYKKEFQNEDHILCFEIYKIIKFPYLFFSQLKSYNLETKSVYYQLPNNLNIEIRSNQIEQIYIINDDSILKKIPDSLFQTNIFPFLDILDMFKLRIICRYLKKQVEQYWYKPFKRELVDYELAKDLAINIEYLKNFQAAAEILKKKLRSCIDEILEYIDWQQIQEQIQTNSLQLNVYSPLIMMLRLFNKQSVIRYPFQIDGQFCIKELAQDIKQQILDYLNLELLPLSFKQMKQIQNESLSSIEFNLSPNQYSKIKLNYLLIFLLQALYFHGWMLQIITIYKEILKKRKRELNSYDERSKYNKEFLRFACKYIYSMIDYSPVKDTKEQQEIISTLNQKLIEGLREINFSVHASPQSHPSVTICQENAITDIHLDIYSQIELLTYVYARQKNYFQDLVDSDEEQQQFLVQEIQQTNQIEKEENLIQTNEKQDFN